MVHHKKSAVALVVCSLFLSLPAWACQPAEKVAAAPVVHAVLNGLAIDIDSSSGNILKLAYPGAGTILEAKPEKAGLLDMAYPLTDFEPFRLSSTYSTGTRIEQTSDAVTISWDKLGGSRSFEFLGKVSATAKLSADPDGQSVTLTCTIDNRSQRILPQVLFPNLHRFVPLSGDSETRIRSGGIVFVSFRDTKRPEGADSTPTPAPAATPRHSSRVPTTVGCLCAGSISAACTEAQSIHAVDG
jgi:hypothetical protein